MNSEIQPEASNLREKAEQLLNNRPVNTNPNPSEGDVLKLLHELEVYSVELELQNEELLNAREISQEVIKKYQLSEPELLKLIRELEVNQIQLELQSRELKFSQAVSQDVAERYTDLFHFSSSGYLILSKEGEIIDLNKSAARLLGKERLNLKNSMFGFFVADKHKPIYNDFLQKVFTTKSKTFCELSLLFEDATPIYIHLSAVITQNEQQCLMTIIDITEQKRNETYREMTRDVLHVLNETGELKGTIVKVLNLIKSRIGLDAVGLRLQNGDDYPYLVHDGFSKEFLSTENSLTEIDNTGKVCRDIHGNPKLACTCGLVISGKINNLDTNVTPVGSWWTNNSTPILDIPANKDARFNPRNICVIQGYSSAALIPIRINSVIVGLIQLNDKRKDRFSYNTIETIEGLASHIGALIMRKQAEEKLRKNEELLRTITENAPDILMQVDRAGTILYINREKNGSLEKDCVGKNFCMWTLPEFHGLMNQSLERVFTEATSQTFISQEKSQYGTIGWFRINISPVKANGDVTSAVLVSRDITERIQAEETIQHNLEHHRTIIQTAIDGFMIVDKDGNLIDVNNSYCKMSGYSAQELLSMRISYLEAVDSENTFAGRIHKIKTKGEDRFESDHRRKDGKIFNVELSVKYQSDSGGQFVVFIHDITKRKRNEKKIRESEERYSLINNSSRDSIYSYDKQGRFTSANRSLCELLQLEASQIIGRTHAELGFPEQLQKEWDDLHQKIYKTNKSVIAETTAPYVDGSIHNYEVVLNPLHDQFGNIIGIGGTTRDITEKKQTEKKIKEKEELLTKAQEIAHLGSWSLDLETNSLTWSDEIYRIFGLDLNKSSATYEDFLAAVHPDDREKVDSAYFNSIEEGKDIYEIEHRIIRKHTGEVRYVYEKCEHIRDASGKIVRSVGMVHDITERKQAEEKLWENEQKLTEIYNSMSDGLAIHNVVYDNDGNIIDSIITEVNPAFEKIIEVNRTEFIGKKVSETIIKRMHLFLGHYINVDLTGEPTYFDIYDERLHKYLSFSVFTQGKGKFVTVVRNITFQKQAEEAILKSERKLSDIYNSMSEGLAIHELLYDSAGNPINYLMEEINPAYEKITGVKRVDIKGKKVTDVYSVELAPYLDIYSQVAITGTPTTFETYFPPLKKYFLISVFSPEKGKFATVFQDITIRRIAEEALKVSESKFRNLVSDIHVGVLLQGLDSKIILCNPKALELLGLTEDQLLGKTSYDEDWKTIHEDGTPFYADSMPVPQVIATGKSVLNVVMGVYRSLTAEWIWLLVDAIPQFNENGSINQVICTFIDITQLKKIEEERKYLLAAVQNMDSVMTVKDLNLRVIAGNNAFLKVIGHETIQTAIGKTDAELWNVIPETEPIHTYMEDERNAQKLNQGEYILREEPVILPNGETRLMLTKKYPVFDDDGNLICTSNISIDITERKRMENALRESEERLKYHFENSPLAVVEWNNDFIVTQWSIEAERIFGWRKEDIIGKRIDMPHLIYEMDIPLVNSVLQRLSSGKEEVVVSTNRNMTKSGEVLVCTWYNSVLLDENGEMSSVMSLVQDITKEKQAEELLRESEEKFSLVFEKSPYVIVLSSDSEGLVDVNEAFVNIFGFSKEEARGKEIDELGFKFNSQLMEKIVFEMSNNGFIHDLESIFNTKSGEERIFRYNIDTILSGNKKYTLTTAEDITTRKKIEEALRESEYFFRESQKAAFIGSYKTDFKTGKWESSEVLDQIFGIDETYDRSVEGWLDITHPDDRKMMNLYLRNEVLKKHIHFNKEYRIIRKNDGEVRWVHGLGKVDVDSKNNVTSLVGTIQDITERRLKEETLYKLNQALVALNKSNQAMIQSLDEADYLKQVCQIVVEDTDFPMVWIGYAQDDDAKTILPVASAGFKDDYLETIKLSWDDSKNGRGPTGTVIRTGQMSVSNNMFTDSTFEPWREHALKRGFAASSVFPLKTGDKAFGVMSIYSTKTEAFLDVEIQMLSELANDLAQGITTIRLRAAHQLAEKALSKSYGELEVLVKERTRELQITNELLIKEINIRKQQEEYLKLTEEKYRTVADFATNWEFWVGANNVMLYCSPSCERITGYSVNEFIQDSKLISSIIYPDDLELYLTHQKKELKAQICDHEIQYRIIRKDGTVRWIGHFCQPIYNSSGLFNGTRGSNKDITVRKKMEELLKASNRKYNLLSENISDGIFILKKGHFEYVNKSVCDIFGYTKDELEGMKLTQFVIPDQHKELDDFLDTVSSVSESRTFEVQCSKSDSTIIYVEIILNYISSEKLIYGVIHDITEKKQIQKSIVKAIIRTEEKERTHFSKELHDGLGPLLSTIKLYLQWSERPNANMSHTEIVKNAESILEEAITTVREISYKLSPHLLTNYGLNSAIKSFVDKIKITSSVNFIFESNYNKRLDIEIEATLYRAIIECINNSIKYANAKNILIKLEEIDNQLHLTYSDDGVGFDISETLLKHKGLGLFNLQNRINTIGGKLNLISYPGSGVEYHFFLDI